MNAGRWSELRAEQEVRYTGVESFLVITISKTSGLRRCCVGWWLVFAVQRSDRRSRRNSHVDVSPSGAKSRVAVHVFCVEVVGHQDRQSPAETGGQVRSDQWAGR